MDIAGRSARFSRVLQLGHLQAVPSKRGQSTSAAGMLIGTRSETPHWEEPLRGPLLVRQGLRLA